MQPAQHDEPSFEELDPNAWIGFRDGKLIQLEPSPYAWMSVQDGELMKSVLLNAPAARRDTPARVIEWGSGKSTFSFTNILSAHGVRYRWLSLEYDREFCDREIAPELLRRPAGTLRYVEDDRVLTGPAGEGSPLEVVCWNSSALQPFMGDDHAADRTADLDMYVNYPSSLGERFDVIIVDGRKRRRCLLAALDLLAEHGIVLLHDAYRSYYHCATDTYPAAQFLGDALWVGARDAATLEAALDGVPR